MEGNKVNGLYFLQGNTMTDLVDASSSDNFGLLAVLAQQSEEEHFMSHVPYYSAFRSIMYIMMCICPDISHSISIVSLGKVHL